MTVSVAVNNKTYDGTTAATGSMNVNGVIARRRRLGGGGLLQLRRRQRGDCGKTVTIAGVALDGLQRGQL